MIGTERQELNFSGLDARPELVQVLERVAGKCIRCPFCRRECAFLTRHGSPWEIASRFADGNRPEDWTGLLDMAFECSLCGLCSEVCPVGVDPAGLFLAMRREAVARGRVDLSRYGQILNYERLGASRFLSLWALPANCDTVFFPGCTLPGTRPEVVWKLVVHLRQSIPALGVVLDCCGKPSHDLGRQDFFDDLFGELHGYLLEAGVKRVLTACPNCSKVWKGYGRTIECVSVYEWLAGHGLPETPGIDGSLAVHDACAVRWDADQQEAVRDILERKGAELIPLAHERSRTQCCGEGGSVPFYDKDLARNWTKLRSAEAGENLVTGYCAGCVNMLKNDMRAVHLLDLLFTPAEALAGRAKVSRAPMTYANRVRLKLNLRQLLSGAQQLCRNRPDIERGAVGLLGKLLG